LIVPLIVAGLLTWLALVNPASATAIGLGLSALYLMYRLNDD
jgi:hypothetical protein